MGEGERIVDRPLASRPQTPALSDHPQGSVMNRAERRRAARHAARGSVSWEPPPHGCVVGTLDDGRAWIVRFPTTSEAEQFLEILGPPPATEARLQTALKIMGKGARHG